MFCITLIIFFSFYKFISRNIFFVFCSIFLRRNSLTFFIDIFCYYFWCRSSLLFVDMFCITFIIFFSFYKFISRNIFFVFCSIFLRRNSLTFFIDIFCYYFWCRSSLLFVDMFCITFIIFFSFYKFISRNIFFVFCSIFLRRNSLTFFIDIFCNYICRWCDFLVDMFCISLIIFFGSYKFISRNIFFVFCSIFLSRNSLTIFINVFCYYICRWCYFLLVYISYVLVTFFNFSICWSRIFCHFNKFIAFKCFLFCFVWCSNFCVY